MIEINGKKVPYKSGQTVLDAAKEAGIYIPTLCTHPELPPFGACRLCIVKIEGIKGFPTACTTPARDGMIISTEDEQLQGLRGGVLEMLLSEHPNTCIICKDSAECEECHFGPAKAGTVTGCTFCPKKENCEIRDVADYLGLEDLRLPFYYKNLPTERDDIFFDRDYNLCILCGRCVRVCQDIRGAGTLAFTQRSNRTKVGAAFNKLHIESNCGFCGACIDVCPTGALSARGSKWYGDADGCTDSVCMLCNVGCTLSFETKWGQVVAAIPDGGHTRGQACSRGRFCIPPLVNQTDRLKQPMIRVDGKLIPVSWGDAIEYASKKLGEYKPDEVGLLVSPFLTNEGAYILQKFARTALSTNNIDSTISDFITPVIGALEESGVGWTKGKIKHLENSKWVIILGDRLFNPPNALIPSIYRAKKNGARVIQITSEEGDVPKIVDSHLTVGPSETLSLFYGIILRLIESNPDVGEYENSKAFLESIKSIAVSKLKDVDEIDEIADLINGGRGSIIFDQDSIRCSSPENLVKAITNTLILTQNTKGFIPYFEAGNVQGTCDVGALRSYLPGYAPPDGSGKSLKEMLDGSVKALYLTEALPAKKLGKIEFLILQDIYSSTLLDKADVVFPACAFTEEDGTLTTLEGTQKIGKAVSPPGSAQPDWKIVSDLANKMGAKGFEYQTAKDVLKEINAAQKSSKKGGKPKLLPFAQETVKDIPPDKPRYWYRGGDIAERVEDFRIQIQGGDMK